MKQEVQIHNTKTLGNIEFLEGNHNSPLQQTNTHKIQNIEPKTLVVSFGKDDIPKTYELNQVENNTFVLTKDSLTSLTRAQIDWVQINISISKSDYQKIIDLSESLAKYQNEGFSKLNNDSIDFDNQEIFNKSRISENSSVLKKLDNFLAEDRNDSDNNSDGESLEDQSFMKTINEVIVDNKNADNHNFIDGNANDQSVEDKSFIRKVNEVVNQNQKFDDYHMEENINESLVENNSFGNNSFIDENPDDQSVDDQSFVRKINEVLNENQKFDDQPMEENVLEPEIDPSSFKSKFLFKK